MPVSKQGGNGEHGFQEQYQDSCMLETDCQTAYMHVVSFYALTRAAIRVMKDGFSMNLSSSPCTSKSYLRTTSLVVTSMLVSGLHSVCCKKASSNCGD